MKVYSQSKRTVTVTAYCVCPSVYTKGLEEFLVIVPIRTLLKTCIGPHMSTLWTHDCLELCAWLHASRTDARTGQALIVVIPVKVGPRDGLSCRPVESCFLMRPCGRCTKLSGEQSTYSS